MKAGLAHLGFVTVHPFDDGNGRMARAIGDMALARGEQSAQIQLERKDYYDRLERTQKGSLDVTDWLEWILGVLSRAIQGAEVARSPCRPRPGFGNDLQAHHSMTGKSNY